MTRDTLVPPSVKNVGRCVADAFLSYPALVQNFKGRVPTESDLVRVKRDATSLWRRVVHVQVTGKSTREATKARLYDPLLKMLGFERAPAPRKVDLEPDLVSTWLYSDSDDKPQLCVEPTPFGISPDDRLTKGDFRGSPQRKIDRLLPQLGADVGLIQGGPNWRIVLLDTAGEPRFLEFDLEAMLEGADDEGFMVFGTLVCPSALLGGDSSLLAEVVRASEERGTSVSEALGSAARASLQTMLEGVRTDVENVAWAPAAFANESSLRPIFEEGIHYLYRLLFVLYAESMAALPLDNALYFDAYSIERLRSGLYDIEAFSAASYVIWDSLQALFRLIDYGATTSDLHVPSYNGGLFAQRRTKTLDRARVNDAVMAQMLRELTTVQIKVGKSKNRDRVSFRELGVSQLGAVFESLLDYEPHVAEYDLYERAVGSGKTRGISYLPGSAVADDRGVPDVRAGSFYLAPWGGTRKSTGAYYTPQVIAEYLVREALGPQVVGLTSTQILELSVCDPAMGSGGFLVAAANYLGECYYEALVAEGLCDPDSENARDDKSEARRVVAEHCLYGVDQNPLAVELAKVSLWLTALSYDRPLSFFDHHLRCGNSLLGAPLRDEAGHLTGNRLALVPQAALADVDSEATASEKEQLKRARNRNNEELRKREKGWVGQLFGLDISKPLHDYAEQRKLMSLDDPTLSAERAVDLIRSRERRLRDLTEDSRSPFGRLKEICDLWMSPWFWPIDARIEPPSTEELATAANEIWAQPQRLSQRTADLLDVSRAVGRDRRFFHWELEFPEVFERGGFSAFVGNPPWETLGTETKEFFSNFDPLFRTYGKQKALQRMLELRRVLSTDGSFRRYNRFQLQLASFLRKSGVYTWYAMGNLGKGDFDLFRAFIERDFRALSEGGRLGQVLKDGLYMNANCTEIRKRLISEGAIDRLIVSENRSGIFPIDSRIKVALLSVTKGPASDTIPMAFFVGKSADGKERSLSQSDLKRVLASPSDYTSPIKVDFIRRLSPSTLSFPEIVASADAELLDWLLRHGIPFSEAWEPAYCRELDASNDSDLFKSADQLKALGCRRKGWNWVHQRHGEFWPLVEGRNIYQFEFPVGDFDKWVNAAEGSARLPKAPDGKPVNLHPRLAWRDVASSTNERTVIAALIPPRTFCKDKAPTVRGGHFQDRLLKELAALLNSITIDWQFRIRGASGLKYTALAQILVPDVLARLALTSRHRPDQEVRVLAAFNVPFDLAEHMFSQFPLLDRLMPPIDGERRSTITRDLVLAGYGEKLRHERATYYRDRAQRATALGAKPFVPATRAEPEAESDDDGVSINERGG